MRSWTVSVPASRRQLAHTDRARELTTMETDCRADVGSDHHLLVAKCRLRLTRPLPKPQRPRPYDVAKLNNPSIARQFKLELRNRFEPLARLDDDETVEDKWSRFQRVVNESATATIGRKRGTHRERWIKDDTWRLIDARHQLKQKRDHAPSGPASTWRRNGTELLTRW